MSAEKPPLRLALPAFLGCFTALSLGAAHPASAALALGGLAATVLLSGRHGGARAVAHRSPALQAAIICSASAAAISLSALLCGGAIGWLAAISALLVAGGAAWAVVPREAPRRTPLTARPARLTLTTIVGLGGLGAILGTFAAPSSFTGVMLFAALAITPLHLVLLGLDLRNSAVAGFRSTSFATWLHLAGNTLIALTLGLFFASFVRFALSR